MKKLILLFAVLFAFSLLAGCSGGKKEQAADGTLLVLTSFYPMYDFALKVGGDKVSVMNMTPAGVEPHDWEPSSSDMINLEKADVFVYNGSGMEHWVDSVLTALENNDLFVVETSLATPRVAADNEDMHTNADDPDHEDADQDQETDSQAIAESYDPHVWLNPQYAKMQMHAILNAFIAADPDNAEYFQKNYDTYASEFDKLDKEFTVALAQVPQKNIVVAHSAFSYLCNAYGLKQMPIEGLSADSEPDAARMSEIIDFVRENNVKVIFFEELVSPKVAEAIARETGSSTAVLNPLEGISEDGQAAGEDYFSVMRTNLITLTESLSK